MIDIQAHRLSEAVFAICPDIEERVASREPKLDERFLWYELSCCLLSSQVPYPLAVAAADAIDQSNLIFDNGVTESELASSLNKILTERLIIDGKHRSYRFPTLRANQLASIRTTVTKEAGDLKYLLQSFQTASDARSWLVVNAPGIGPKQASMFLRNTCLSYDLAIIDRHVLDYMAAIGIYSIKSRSISGLANYQKYEQTLVSHSAGMGVKVGLLDWAIWIVMRAAKSFPSTMVIT